MPYPAKLRVHFLACLLCLLFAFLPQIAKANGHRVALVVGNAAYENVTVLNNATNDAVLASQLFDSLGFDVTLLVDVDASVMRAALADFLLASDQAEAAVIYFAGHGIQVEGENYLLTVESRGETLESAQESSVHMAELIAAFSDTASAKLLFLDACRNNPFEELTRSLLVQPKSGLARSNHEEQDLLVVYAAQPNRVALDGGGVYSPFTAAISDVFSNKPTVDLQDALIEVTNHVRSNTGNRQSPWIEGQMFRLSFELSVEIAVPREVPKSCSGPVHSLPIARRESDFLEFRDQERQLLFDNRLLVCTKNDVVTVSGAFDADYSCKDILDNPDDGVGYYFGGGAEPERHFWFHIDPDRSPRTLEMGVYENGEQLYWIDTHIPMCAL